MRALITGMDGFIGSHLADFLLEKGFSVYGTFHRGQKNTPKAARAIKCDVSKKGSVANIIKRIRPDYVFHMAAQSFVVPSWLDPETTMRANVIGTLNILEALKNTDTKVAVACSSAEYGLTQKSELPIKEENALRPSSPYAVSKVGTDMVSYVYYNAYGMKLFRIRFFNIIGTRKRMDACSDFARGIVEVEKGKKKYLEVGNLDGVRDFTDVRDAVKAVWMITKKGKYGDVYNVCSGRGHKMRDVLDILLSMSNRKIEVKQSDKRMRKIDDPIFIGDNSKLRGLGWKQDIRIEKTLQDLIDYWRNEIK